MKTTDYEIDVADALHRILVDQGYTHLRPLDRRDTLQEFFDLRRGRIKPVPRHVFASQDFSHCPAKVLADFRALVIDILAGRDLNRRTSCSTRQPSSRGRLLHDWGLHHFHLGASPHHQQPDRPESADYVAVARVQSNAVYVSGVFPRRERTAWSKRALLEPIHRAWPQVLERFRIGEHHSRRGEGTVTMPDGTAYTPSEDEQTCGSSRTGGERSLFAVLATMKLTKLLRKIHTDLGGQPGSRIVRNGVAWQLVDSSGTMIRDLPGLIDVY